MYVIHADEVAGNYKLLKKQNFIYRSIFREVGGDGWRCDVIKQSIQRDFTHTRQNIGSDIEVKPIIMKVFKNTLVLFDDTVFHLVKVKVLFVKYMYNWL